MCIEFFKSDPFKINLDRSLEKEARYDEKIKSFWNNRNVSRLSSPNLRPKSRENLNFNMAPKITNSKLTNLKDFLEKRKREINVLKEQRDRMINIHFKGSLSYSEHDFIFKKIAPKESEKTNCLLLHALKTRKK